MLSPMVNTHYTQTEKYIKIKKWIMYVRNKQQIEESF